MSNRLRRKFLHEMKEKLTKQGILKEKTVNPMIFLQLNDKEVKQQLLYSVIATFALILLFLCLPAFF